MANEKKTEQQERSDVTQGKVIVHLPRALPQEEDAIFVSNGRENILVKKGVEVEVPYWAAQRLQQMEDAQRTAAAYERYSSEMASRV